MIKIVNEPVMHAKSAIKLRHTLGSRVTRISTRKATQWIKLKTREAVAARDRMSTYAGFKLAFSFCRGVYESAWRGLGLFADQLSRLSLCAIWAGD